MAEDNQDIKITGQPSLDPQVCRFIVDHPMFPDGSANCRNKEMARGSLLFEALFALEGVSQVMVADDTLTVVKTGTESWPELGKKIGTVVREQIRSGKQLIHPDAKKAPSEERIRQMIEELFENDINPAISSHGGRVELADVEGTKVYLRLGGGCQGCASAHLTLKYGIEKAIRSAIPEVSEVVDITDHKSGANPFYQ